MLEENIVVNELTDTLKLSKIIYIFNIIIYIFLFLFILVHIWYSIFLIINLLIIILFIYKIYNKEVFIKEKNENKFYSFIYYFFCFIIYFIWLILLLILIYWIISFEYLSWWWWWWLLLIYGLLGIILPFYIILSIISLFFYKINYIEITKEEYDKLK